MTKYLLSFLVATLCLVGVTHAQSVAVVMSGGGAKGLYHVGAIKALEENGIPIDYVSGTSMGSIISGLYASGYSPLDMEELCLSGKFSELMSPKLNDKYRQYYQEMNSNPEMVSLRIKPEPQTDQEKAASDKRRTRR